MLQAKKGAAAPKPYCAAPVSEMHISTDVQTEHMQQGSNQLMARLQVAGTERKIYQNSLHSGLNEDHLFFRRTVVFM